jgi:chromosomal replication initiation ATPase DnaA
MAELLGIATELAERRQRIAAVQSKSVQARIMPVAPIGMADEIKRLTTENGRLNAQVAKLSDEVRKLQGVVEVREAMPTSLREMPYRAATNLIIKVFARHYGVHPGDILSDARDRHIIRARYAVYQFLMRDMAWSKTSVGRELRRDRASLRAAKDRIDKLAASNPAWRKRYEDAAAELLGAQMAEAA